MQNYIYPLKAVSEFSLHGIKEIIPISTCKVEVKTLHCNVTYQLVFGTNTYKIIK